MEWGLAGGLAATAVVAFFLEGRGGKEKPAVPTVETTAEVSAG